MRVVGAIGIEQPGFLHDRAAVLDQIDLAARFRARSSAITKRTELTFLVSVRVPSSSPGLRTRDVDVRAHRAFFHVAVAPADIAQDRAQLADIGPGFGRRAHVRAADDLHQRHARAVEIDVGHRRVLVVHQLAGILLDMDALDADHLVLRDPGLLVGLDRQRAFAHQRVVELADLVALRQIGVEVVLAVEPATTG